ncbi:MAG TPA: sulfatase, partial [bacterium]|nr:sulfatase [bacterium]
MNSFRRQFFRFRSGPGLLAAVLAGCGGGAGPGEPGPSARPPIVLFSIDTLRADRLGCYGAERATSPRIDAFAGEAVRFAETIAQAPLTAPSHMSIFTSLYPPVHRVVNYERKDREPAALDDALVTLPRFLHDRGYLTVGLTGGGQVAGELGFDRGFDYYGDDFLFWENDGGRYRPTLESLAPIEEALRDRIGESRREGRPLFLFLHHYLCHDPYVKGPDEYRQKFLGDPVAGLPRRAEDLDFSVKFSGVRAQFFGKADPGNPAHLRQYLALYDGGVLFADAVFGRIVDLLREEGIYDDALVVLVADHGEEFLEHGGILHSHLFRETLHVPLIVKFPGGRFAGHSVERPVESFDIFPTVADWLGLKDELPQVQGRSLLPLVRGDGGFEGSPVSFSGSLHSVRFSRGGYTYSSQSRGRTPEWLFGAGDVGERRNLAPEKPELAADLRRRAREIVEENRAWRQKLVAGGSERGAALSPERVRQLRALG